MTIRRLVLSGGGPSGICYGGIFKALFDKKIINKNLDGIEEIITTSVGILPCLNLLLKLDINIWNQLIMGYDLNNILNIEKLDINDFINDCGLFDTDGIENIFKSIIKNHLGSDDLSMKELFDLSKIKLVVKVFNATKRYMEYISYENYPDLSIITLARMTTAIPLFFKPVSYNDCMYVDGGIKGSLPIDYIKDNQNDYLGIFITGNEGSLDKFLKNDFFNIVPIVKIIFSIMLNDYNTENEKILINDNKNIMKIPLVFGLNFDIDDHFKKEIIQKGYDLTIDYINTELITSE